MTTSPKRRTRMKGAPGVYRSSSGRYEIAFRDSTGKLKFQVVDGSFEDAKRARGDIVARMAKGERVAPTKDTFATFAASWLETQGHLRPHTRAIYELAIRLHLNPVLGDRKLASIDEDDVLKVIGRMRASGAAPWTIKGVLTPLGRILNHAARRGLIASNPITRLERRERPAVERREMRILGRDEIGKLLDVAPPRFRTLLAAAVLTGMRQGELLGLQWDDVDFDANMIHVRQQANQKGQLVEPKTPQAKRAIVLSPGLGRMLREHKMASKFKGVDDLVFPSATGRPQNGRNVARRGLEKALAEADLAKLRFHDLRHTYASLLIAEGLNVVFVSRQMGHSSPDITLRVYSHLWGAAEHASKASAALDSVYGTNAADAAGGGTR